MYIATVNYYRLQCNVLLQYTYMYNYIFMNHCRVGFRPALACLERLKDNPVCGSVQLPEEYYHSTEAFLRK